MTNSPTNAINYLNNAINSQNNAIKGPIRSLSALTKSYLLLALVQSILACKTMETFLYTVNLSTHVAHRTACLQLRASCRVNKIRNETNNAARTSRIGYCYKIN